MTKDDKGFIVKFNPFFGGIMARHIPGHFRAITVWVLLVVGLVTWITTGNLRPVVGMAVMVLGIFVADQATHLAQHHDEVPPTWVEQIIQRHHWPSVIVSLVLALVGLYLALIPIN